MYIEEFNKIYGKGKDKKEDIVELIDSEEIEESKIIVNITNNFDNLIEDGLNIVDSYGYPKELNYNIEVVEDYLKIKLENNSVDELIIDVVDYYSVKDVDDLLNNLLPSLKVGGEVYIEGTSLKNILDFFFSPNPMNGNTVTQDLMKIGISALFDGKKSTLVPEIVLPIMEEHGLKNVMTKDKGIKVIIKGVKGE
jgi:hypothetical protein